MEGNAGSTVLEKGQCPLEFFVRGETFGFKDDVELSSPFAEIAFPSEGWRVDFKFWASRGRALNHDFFHGGIGELDSLREQLLLFDELNYALIGGGGL